MAVTQFYKVSMSYIMHLLTGASTNIAVTSGGAPSDAKFDDVQIDRSTNPPTIVVRVTSASGSAPTGFGAPVTGNGRIDLSENWGHK